MRVMFVFGEKKKEKFDCEDGAAAAAVATDNRCIFIAAWCIPTKMKKKLKLSLGRFVRYTNGIGVAVQWRALRDLFGKWCLYACGR